MLGAFEGLVDEAHRSLTGQLPNGLPGQGQEPSRRNQGSLQIQIVALVVG